jgi:hypothetical protein
MPDEPQTFSKIAQRLIGDFRRLPLKEPEKMRRRSTKEVGAVLEELRVKYQIGRSTPEQAIRDQWAELVGPANATYSHPLRLDGSRRLVVQATHGVVRNELFLNRETILDRIRKLPGCATIKSLHLVPG